MTVNNFCQIFVAKIALLFRVPLKSDSQNIHIRISNRNLMSHSTTSKRNNLSYKSFFVASLKIPTISSKHHKFGFFIPHCKCRRCAADNGRKPDVRMMPDLTLVVLDCTPTVFMFRASTLCQTGVELSNADRPSHRKFFGIFLVFTEMLWLHTCVEYVANVNVQGRGSVHWDRMSLVPFMGFVFFWGTNLWHLAFVERGSVKFDEISIQTFDLCLFFNSFIWFD